LKNKYIYSFVVFQSGIFLESERKLIKETVFERQDRNSHFWLKERPSSPIILSPLFGICKTETWVKIPGLYVLSFLSQFFWQFNLFAFCLQNPRYSHFKWFINVVAVNQLLYHVNYKVLLICWYCYEDFYNEIVIFVFTPLCCQMFHSLLRADVFVSTSRHRLRRFALFILFVWKHFFSSELFELLESFWIHKLFPQLPNYRNSSLKKITFKYFS